MAKISELAWETRYGIHTLQLANGFIQIDVEPANKRDESGYRVSVKGRLARFSRTEYPTVDEAKHAGVALAKRLLKQMTDELA